MTHAWGTIELLLLCIPPVLLSLHSPANTANSTGAGAQGVLRNPWHVLTRCGMISMANSCHRTIHDHRAIGVPFAVTVDDHYSAAPNFFEQGVLATSFTLTFLQQSKCIAWQSDDTTLISTHLNVASAYLFPTIAVSG